MAPEKEKITRMILYVDLKCTCCYKKVRKLLCKFPQIRDQVFDVDKNKVTITVVCCDPERFRDKLCCKGGRAIQSIEIVEDKPPPPKPSGKQKPPPPAVVPVPEKPKDPPKPPPKSPIRPVAVSVRCQVCYEGWDGGPCRYGCGRLVPPPPCYYYYGYQYQPNRPCYVSRCDYFSEDNPQGCSIM